MWPFSRKQQPIAAQPETKTSTEIVRARLIRHRDYHNDKMTWYETTANQAHQYALEHERIYTAYNKALDALNGDPEFDFGDLAASDDVHSASFLIGDDLRDVIAAQQPTVPVFRLGESVRDTDGTVRILDTQEKVDAENARRALPDDLRKTLPGGVPIHGDPNEAIAVELAKLQPAPGKVIYHGAVGAAKSRKAKRKALLQPGTETVHGIPVEAVKAQ